MRRWPQNLRAARRGAPFTNPYTYSYPYSYPYTFSCSIGPFNVDGHGYEYVFEYAYGMMGWGGAAAPSGVGL